MLRDFEAKLTLDDLKKIQIEFQEVKQKFLEYFTKSVREGKEFINNLNTDPTPTKNPQSEKGDSD